MQLPASRLTLQGYDGANVGNLGAEPHDDLCTTPEIASPRAGVYLASIKVITNRVPFRHRAARCHRVNPTVAKCAKRCKRCKDQTMNGTRMNANRASTCCPATIALRCAEKRMSASVADPRVVCSQPQRCIRTCLSAVVWADSLRSPHARRKALLGCQIYTIIARNAKPRLESRRRFSAGELRRVCTIRQL